MRERLKSLGPGLLVTAAFIGPGTVTTTSVAGTNFGFALLWAVLFAVFATVVLQEMAARLGVVSREGLGEALRTTFQNPVFKILAVLLVIVALGLGNTAFEIGNITGAALGLEALSGVSPRLWAIVIGVVAFALLISGRYKVIERVLVAMVVLMSVLFIITAIVVLRPADVGNLLAGMFVPGIPSGSLVTVIALIGTTVVPYNLFLHASSVQEKWPESVPTRRALAESRLDTSLAIIIGGLITAAILATAAAAFFGTNTEITDGATMAEQLEPLLGPAAKYAFAVGLLAAGLTSAITAPLATAYAISGVLGWERDLSGVKFRLVWAAVLVIGAALAALGQSPVAIIVLAQAANGILLPVIAIFLLVVMNRSDLLREYRNGPLTNVLGIVVVLIASGLGVFRLLQVFGVVPS